jgi:hypothetical protein
MKAGLMFVGFVCLSCQRRYLNEHGKGENNVARLIFFIVVLL